MPADTFARSVFIRSLYARSVLCQRHANAHTLGPPPGPGGAMGPKGPKGQWDQWAFGPRGPSGPLGPFGAQGERLRRPGALRALWARLYVTKAIPNGMDIRGELCTNNSTV